MYQVDFVYKYSIYIVCFFNSIILLVWDSMKA